MDLHGFDPFSTQTGQTIVTDECLMDGHDMQRSRACCLLSLERCRRYGERHLQQVPETLSTPTRNKNNTCLGRSVFRRS